MGWILVAAGVVILALVVTLGYLMSDDDNTHYFPE